MSNWGWRGTGKGRKDRQTPLSSHLKAGLESQFAHAIAIQLKDNKKKGGWLLYDFGLKSEIPQCL
jgi:hypothetical protein